MTSSSTFGHLPVDNVEWPPFAASSPGDDPPAEMAEFIGTGAEAATARKMGCSPLFYRTMRKAGWTPCQNHGWVLDTAPIGGGRHRCRICVRERRRERYREGA